MRAGGDGAEIAGPEDLDFASAGEQHERGGDDEWRAAVEQGDGAIGEVVAVDRSQIGLIGEGFLELGHLDGDLHEDHVGGIAPGGTMAFPNAYVYASKADADYWLSDAHERAAPAFLRGQFEGAKRSLVPYTKAGRFRAIPAPGHTPGHTFYEVESQTQRLLIWGAVVHVAALQFPDPSIGTEYDTDPTQAEKTRLKVFAEAKADGVLVGAMHVSFPGLGHVGQSGTSFFWIPAEYSARL